MLLLIKKNIEVLILRDKLRYIRINQIVKKIHILNVDYLSKKYLLRTIFVPCSLLSDGA